MHVNRFRSITPNSYGPGPAQGEALRARSSPPPVVIEIYSVAGGKSDISSLFGDWEVQPSFHPCLLNLPSPSSRNLERTLVKVSQLR